MLQTPPNKYVTNSLPSPHALAELSNSAMMLAENICPTTICSLDQHDHHQNAPRQFPKRLNKMFQVFCHIFLKIFGLFATNEYYHIVFNLPS